jgi:hypothetical protein
MSRPVWQSVILSVGIGLFDYFSWFRVVRLLLKSRELRGCFTRILTLNILLYLGSVVIIRDLIITKLVLLYEVSRTLLLVISYVSWFIPAYCICFILNNQLYQQLADIVPSHPPAKTRQLRTFSEEIYRALFLFVHFSLLYSLELFSPILYWIIGVPSMAWLYSLYAHEYVWARGGIPLEARLARVEGNVFYHFGFGLFPASIMMFTSIPVGFALLSIAFSIAVLMASIKSSESSHNLGYRFPIFAVSLWVTDSLLLAVLSSTVLLKNSKGKDKKAKGD